MAVFLAFTGCEDEFTDIGGEIINNPTDVVLEEFEVNAFNRRINAVQTNNLQNLFLGTYDHPVYGETTASIVSQLVLSSTDPVFGDNVQLDSVVLRIPYYATAADVDDDGVANEFILDSVFGSGSYDLSIYETNYFLNDYDPDANFQQRQRYYSDMQPVFEQQIIGEPLYVEADFEPSAEPSVAYEPGDTEETDTISLGPAFTVQLPVDYFQEKIIDKQGSSELANNTNFRNYFRNIFIKAESNGSGGSLSLLNLVTSTAQNSDDLPRVTLYYRRDVEDEDGEVSTVRDSYDLNFGSANKLNTYTGNYPADVLEGMNDSENGAENLFLKGTEGSIAIIDLFPDESVLEAIKEEDWLVNEANLTFYVNQDLVNGAIEPERVYLYDFENNTVIDDWINDVVNENNPNQSRLTFSQPLERDEDENGVFYKVRLTRYISSLLNDDNEVNVRLGLVVTGNINSASFSAVRESGDVDRIPSATSLTPLGTVIYGDEHPDEEKRLKLRIYHTEYN